MMISSMLGSPCYYLPSEPVNHYLGLFIFSLLLPFLMTMGSTSWSTVTYLQEIIKRNLSVSDHETKDSYDKKIIRPAPINQ